MKKEEWKKSRRVLYRVSRSSTDALRAEPRERCTARASLLDFSRRTEVVTRNRGNNCRSVECAGDAKGEAKKKAVRSVTAQSPRPLDHRALRSLPLLLFGVDRHVREIRAPWKQPLRVRNASHTWLKVETCTRPLGPYVRRYCHIGDRASEPGDREETRRDKYIYCRDGGRHGTADTCLTGQRFFFSIFFPSFFPFEHSLVESRNKRWEFWGPLDFSGPSITPRPPPLRPPSSDPYDIGYI